MQEYISIAEIATHLNVNRWTIYRWIDWYYSDLPKPKNIYLPDFIRQGVSKMYKKSDIQYFEKFQRELPRGAMAAYNRYHFSESKKVTKTEKAAILHSVENQKAIKYRNNNNTCEER